MQPPPHHHYHSLLDIGIKYVILYAESIVELPRNSLTKSARTGLKVTTVL